MEGKNFEGTITDKEEVKREGAKDISEHNYEQYQGLGGTINKKDYQGALDKAKDTTTPDKATILQAESMAKRAGIILRNSKDAIDQRTILYGILRTDTKSEEVKYHYSQMSDQRLFAEVLRMLGDADSLQKLIETHPQISFS